jgi:hypothetical protein
LDKRPEESIPSLGINPGLNTLLDLIAVLPNGGRPNLVLIGQVKPGLIGPGVLAVHRFFLDLTTSEFLHQK